MREDKGQNQSVIEWLRRVDPERVFLRAGNDTWTYGQTRAEVTHRLDPTPRLVTPTLSPESVFDVIGGLGAGGLTVKGSGAEHDLSQDSLLVVYTSGTTGAPKGVRLTRANLKAAAASSAEHLGHGPDDDWLLAMPLHHVGGLSILVRQLYTGGSITLLPRFAPQAFAAAMHGQVTMVSVVPTMLRRIIAFGPFHGLRAVLVGGGPIPDGLLDEAVDSGLPVLPTYGMTETFGQVATLLPGSPPARKAHPLPGIDIRIEDDRRIAIRGDQVSPGYLGEPDRVDPWLVTNDLGELDDDGALRVLGRADDVIVTGGENVNPEQVEAVLRGHDGVDEVCVVGVDDDEWGQVVVGVYEGTALPEALASWAADRIPAHMVPKRLHRVFAIPRTAIGKPDRNAIGGLGLGRSD